MIEKSAVFRLTVWAVPDFELFLPSTEGVAYAGQVFPINVEVRPVDQFAGDVDLSVEGVPPGTTVEFFPSSKVTVAPGAARGVQINLHLPADNAIVGTYELTIRAVSTQYNGA